MVRNSDIETEFHLFSEVWKVYKRLLPVKPRHDEPYWTEVTEAVCGIMSSYPGQLAKDLALAVLNDLERRCMENENQDTGC